MLLCFFRCAYVSFVLFFIFLNFILVVFCLYEFVSLCFMFLGLCLDCGGGSEKMMQ